MKKFLAVIAALVLCLTACACFAEADSDLASAKAYIYQLYKNPTRKDIKVTLTDFDILGKVAVDGVEYAVEWAVDTESVKLSVNEDGSVHVNINEKSPVELVYTLTATVKDAAGNAEAVSFQRKVPAAATTGVMYVETPEVGVAYKFALDQNGLTPPTTLFLNGEMSGNYLGTTASVLDAVDVYLEEAEGGYYIYFFAGEAKKYVNITTYTKDDGSLKNTQKIEDAPSVPYTWDAERGTMVADLGELGQYYLGTYNTYNTMSTSSVSYIADVTKIGVSQFPAGFANVIPEQVEEPEVGKAYVFALQQNGLETPAMLFLTGEMSGNYLATSASLSDAAPVYLEQAEGGYYLYCLKDGVKKYGRGFSCRIGGGCLEGDRRFSQEHPEAGRRSLRSLHLGCGTVHPDRRSGRPGPVLHGHLQHLHHHQHLQRFLHLRHHQDRCVSVPRWSV